MGDRRHELVAELRKLADRFTEDARATSNPRWSSEAVRLSNVLHKLVRGGPLLVAALERYAVEDVEWTPPVGVFKVTSNDGSGPLFGTGGRKVVDVRGRPSHRKHAPVEALYWEMVYIAEAMLAAPDVPAHAAVVEKLQEMIAKRTVGFAAPSAVTVAEAVRKTRTTAKREDAEAVVRACFAALGYPRQLGARERQASCRAGKRKRAVKNGPPC